MIKKQIQKLKQALVKIVEEELLAIIALLVIALEIFFTQAQTGDQTNLSFTICPANVGITVVTPNGGERWLLNSSQSITWTTCDPDGAIVNVRIELQRSTGGSWETIIASTPNNGSYTWPIVTEPTTTTALMRISKVGDATNNDTSDAVFTIYSGGGPPPPPCATPVIDSVTPREFINTEDVTLIIKGYFAYGDEQVYLDDELLESTFVSNERIEAIVPAGFPPGRYVLRVTNNCGNYAEYGIKIVVYEEECTDPIIDKVVPQTFYNTEDVTLVITGHFDYGDEEVYLDDELLDSTYISDTRIEAIVPAGFPPGSYTLSVVNGCGGQGEYAAKIVIKEEEEKLEPEPEPGPTLPTIPFFDIIWPKIIKLWPPFIAPPSTGGPMPELKIFTDQFEQRYVCYSIWFIWILLLLLILRDLLNDDDKKNQKKFPTNLR